MIEIIPAILPKSFEDLGENMALVSGLVPMVQVDVCDGVFVSNRTWPYIKKTDPDFNKILKEEGGFPYWEELDFEVDLMVKVNEEIIQNWISAGAKRLVIHMESVDDIETLIHEVRGLLPEDDYFLHTEIGVAIGPDTPNEKLEPIIKRINFVQFMGIQRVGFQGEKFDDRVIDKVSSLRQRHPDVIISVDGGVNMETAPKLIDAGVNRLVIGSAIFESDDIPATVEFFDTLSQE